MTSAAQPELFGQPADAEPSLAEQIAELDRELRLRNRVYPRLVADGRLSEATANRHTRALRAALRTLRGLIYPEK
jgi:hypothetical protein